MKLIKYLEKYSKEDIKEFEKYLASPFLNKGRDYSMFFKKLVSGYPDIEKIAKRIENICDDKKGNKTSLNKIYHITMLSREYLMNKVLQKSKLYLLYRQANAMYNLGFSDEAMEILDNTAVTEKVGIDYYYHKYKIHFLKSLLFSLKSEKKSAYSEIMTSIEYYYFQNLIDVSTFSNDLHAFKLNQNLGEDIKYVEDATNQINIDFYKILLTNSKIKETGLVEIYLFMAENINNTLSIEYLNNFINLYKKYYNELTVSHAHTLLMRILNICILIMHKKNIDTRKIFFSMIKEYFLKYYDDKDNEFIKISFVSFFNVLKSAIVVNELDWAKSFIDKYNSKLENNIRNDVKNYAYGLLYFHGKEYAKSLKFLINVKHSVEILKFDVRVLILQLYYELEYFDQMAEKLDSFSHFLKKTEKTYSYLTEKYNLFLIYLNKLIKFSEKPDRTIIEFTLNELINLNEFEGSKWLIEKFNKLIHNS